MNCADSPADRSYVRRGTTSGVPKEVVARAKSVLDKLESAVGKPAAPLWPGCLSAATAAQKDPSDPA
jgi:hypothetical protein